MNQLYDNFVIENQFESVLKTLLDLQNFMTVDYSLSESAGMHKKIYKRSVTGAVEDLAMTEGNTDAIEVTLSSEDYEVGTTQGRFIAYDEEIMTDPAVLDAGLKGMAEIMVNDFVDKSVAEWRKTSNQLGYSALGFDTIVDALAQLNLENEDSLFMLISPAMVGAFRKSLKDSLQYVEAFARTGYIGSVCGVPVYVTKALAGSEAIIGNKEAVRLFVKKGTEAEQERDANTRKNTYYTRKVALVALVDDRKLIRIAKNASVDATITTSAAGAKAIAGAAATGAKVEVYINGIFDGEAEAESNAYSYTAKENLVAGDVIKVIAKKEGEVDSIATATAA